MSADRWTLCPKCSKTHVSERDRLQAEADAAYGKVPADEFRRLSALVLTADQDGPAETLREDREIGIYGDKFEVNFSSACIACGFKFNFKFEKVVT